MLGSLNEALMSPLEFALSNINGSKSSNTDACAVPMGLLLTQKQEIKRKLFTINPRHYMQKWNDATRTPCNEWTVLLCTLYPVNSRFADITDRKALKQILNLMDSKGTLACRHLRHSEIESSLIYQADANIEPLSHSSLREKGIDITLLENNVPLLVTHTIDDLFCQNICVNDPTSNFYIPLIELQAKLIIDTPATRN